MFSLQKTPQIKLQMIEWKMDYLKIYELLIKTSSVICPSDEFDLHTDEPN